MKRLLTVTAFTALLTLLRMAAGFVIAKVVAIYTGPTGMAMLGQVQSMVASLNGIVNAPAGSGIVRFTAEHHSQGFQACSPWWRASVRWIIILLAVIVPLMFVLAKPLSQWLFNQSELSWLVVITACVLPFSVGGALVNSVINGQQLYKRYVMLGMLSVLISSLVMVILITQANLKGALLAVSMQSGLIGIVMLLSSVGQPWFKLQYWWGVTGTEQRKAIGGYVLMALTSALAIPVSLVLVRNILVVQNGWEQAGQWQAVWKISETYLTVITITLSTYFLPRLSLLRDSKLIFTEINKTVKVVLPIVVGMALCIYLLRDIVISLLFTEEFRPARDLFAIQLYGDVIKIVSWLYAYPLLSRGLTRWFMSTEILFSVSLVFFSYLLVPEVGVVGANIAYAVNYSLYLIFVVFIIKPHKR